MKSYILDALIYKQVLNVIATEHVTHALPHPEYHVEQDVILTDQIVPQAYVDAILGMN